MAVIPVQRQPLSLAERAYLPQVAAGLRITLKHLFAPKETLQYPEQRPAIPPGYRGVPTLVKDPHGREKCVSCQLCEFVCPPKAIRITPGEVPAGAGRDHVEKGPREFDIDMLRCIYCGLCQEVCPEEAIFLQNQYSMSGYSRAEMVNHKDRLYELGGTLPDLLQVGQEEGRRGARPRRPLASHVQSALPLFSVFTVGCAAAVVCLRNAVNAAMCLLLCLAGVAGLFISLDAFLLAFLLILVYAGAVVALFLFIIMLLDIQGQAGPRPPGLGDRGGPGGGGAAAGRLGGNRLPGARRPAGDGGPAPLRRHAPIYSDLLFTTYLLPVEIIGFLLLIAMLGVIALRQRGPARPRPPRPMSPPASMPTSRSARRFSPWDFSGCSCGATRW